MKIYAPVKNATGVWCSVQFKNGVGETDNPHLISWFKEHGYRVEENQNFDLEMQKNEEISHNEAPKAEISTFDFETMTPNELRDWARANGLGSKIKGIRNREKLLEIIRG